MPPHSVYIETHLGGGALMLHKPAALRNIGIDIDGRALPPSERLTVLAALMAVEAE